MRRLIPLLCLAAGLGLVGCQDQPTRPENPEASASTSAGKKVARKHDKWWCDEHGIPEHDCLMCLHGEEAMKKKGDWCEQDEYVKSQCFACNPKLRERYAALYRDKYGKEPPEPDENPGKPDDEPTKGKDEAGTKDRK